MVGNLDSLGGTYRLDLYAGPVADASGNGEGRRWIATGTVPNGALNASIPFVSGATLAAGEFVTATVTDAAGNTSEFSNAVAAASGGGGDGGTEIVIAPEADTFVTEGAVENNYGTLDYADVYGGRAFFRSLSAPVYTLMRFDLSAIPAGATITDVRLETTTRAGYAQDGDPAHWALFLADDAWSETGVTWATRPSDVSAGLQHNGGPPPPPLGQT